MTNVYVILTSVILTSVILTSVILTSVILTSVILTGVILVSFILCVDLISVILSHGVGHFARTSHGLAFYSAQFNSVNYCSPDL